MMGKFPCACQKLCVTVEDIGDSVVEATSTVGYTSSTRMPPEMSYVWDFPTSSTVQDTSAQCPGTFLSPCTFGFHKRRGYLPRRAAGSFSRKTLLFVVKLFSDSFLLNFVYRFKSTRRAPSADYLTCEKNFTGRFCINVLLMNVMRIIQGDQKVSVHLMITIQKVTSNVQSVPRQSPDIY